MLFKAQQFLCNNHVLIFPSSGGSRAGSEGSNEPPLEPKLFHFHGEFQEKLVKLHKSNPPQLIWTPNPKILDLPLPSVSQYIYELVWNSRYVVQSRMNVVLYRTNAVLLSWLSAPIYGEFNSPYIAAYRQIAKKCRDSLTRALVNTVSICQVYPTFNTVLRD